MDAGSLKDRFGIPVARFFPWWAVLVQGIFAVIIGLLLLVHPVTTTIAIVQFVGIYWLVTGVISLVNVFTDRSMWGWKLLSGIIGIVAGLTVMRHPLWSAILVPSFLVIFIGINGIIIGLINIIGALKGDGISTAILGFISIIFGIFLLSSPLVAALALPWVFGIFGVVGGILAIAFAFQRRKIEEPAQ